MAGIYDRDQINYASMIENMIRNRMDRAKLVGDSILKQGEINAETTRNLGNLLSRGIAYGFGEYSNPQASTDEEELARLKDIRAKYQAQVDQRNKFDAIFNRPSNVQNPKYNPSNGPSLKEIYEQEMRGYNPAGRVQSEQMKGYMPTFKELREQHQSNLPSWEEIEEYLKQHPSEEYEDLYVV